MRLTTTAPASLVRAIPIQMADDLIRLWGYTPPIPLEAVAHDLEAVVVAEHLGRRGLLGYSWSSPTGTRVVVVNADQPTPVVRFTLAHELMHRVLHAGRRTRPLHLAPERVDLAEMEANAGAGALLMPGPWLTPRVDAWSRAAGVERPWDVATLESWRVTAGPRWAQEAQVSLTALGYRLVDLGVVSSDAARFWRGASPRRGA